MKGLDDMFSMTVTDAIKVHETMISVAGPCINANRFSNPLKDDEGNIYDAHIPFDKMLYVDDSRIMLGIRGSYDIESFMGKVLVSAT